MRKQLRLSLHLCLLRLTYPIWHPASSRTNISPELAKLDIYVYHCNDAESFEEYAGGRSDGEEVSAATVCELPSRGWEGLWNRYITY